MILRIFFFVASFFSWSLCYSMEGSSSEEEDSPKAVFEEKSLLGEEREQFLEKVQIAELCYSCPIASSKNQKKWKKFIGKWVNQNPSFSVFQEQWQFLGNAEPDPLDDQSGLRYLALYHPKKRVCVIGIRGTATHDMRNFMADKDILKAAAPDGEDPLKFGLNHCQIWKEKREGKQISLRVKIAKKVLSPIINSVYPLGKETTLHETSLENGIKSVARFYIKCCLKLLGKKEKKEEREKEKKEEREKEKEKEKEEEEISSKEEEDKKHFYFENIKKFELPAYLYFLQNSYKRETGDLENKKIQVHFVGHSLGGMVAQVLGSFFKCNTWTINGAGAFNFYKKRFRGYSNDSFITNLRRDNDFVATLTEPLGRVVGYPNYKEKTPRESDPSYILSNHSIENFRKDLERGMNPINNLSFMSLSLEGEQEKDKDKDAIEFFERWRECLPPFFDEEKKEKAKQNEYFYCVLSSNNGYPEAQYRLGVLYLHGYNLLPPTVKIDVLKGRDLLRRASNRHLTAQLHLRYLEVMDYKRKGKKFPLDPVRTFLSGIDEKALDQDGRCWFNLILYHYSKKNKEEVFEKIKDLANFDNNLHAKREICFLDNQLPLQDKLFYLHETSQEGDVESMFRLGLLCYQHKDFSDVKKLSRTTSFMEEACQRGHKEAQLFLKEKRG